MSAELLWNHEIEVAKLPPDGRSFVLVADAPTRERLAKHAKVLSIPELTVKLEARQTASGAEVTGKLEGVVRQRCVLSLEEFDNPVSEQIEVEYAADSAEVTGDVSVDEEDEDLPDPIIDGKIDLGALAAEFLVLAIDPYPRKPGAELPNLPAEKPENVSGKSPFEGLAGLKDRIKK